MARSGTADARQRAWLSAALASFALLLAPLLVWLLLPRSAPLVPSPPPPRSEPVAARRPPPAPEAPEPAPPRPAVFVPEAASPPPEVPVANEGEGPVHGVVLDPDGRPSAGARVTCREDPSVSASTDEGGRFELPAEADGCTATAAQPPFGDAEPTRLARGRENVLRLIAAGAIEGVVVDESGRPVEDYLLAIESFVPSGSGAGAPGAGAGARGGEARKIHDPGGAFRWDDLAPGRYVLAASADGRPPARSSGVDVTPGSTARRVRIVLPRGATLRGTVIDADSRAPIAQAQIELDAATSSRANAISLVLTDEGGGYVLEGVPASGPFSVRVRHERYMTKIVPGLDARGTGAARADIELRPRSEGGPIEEFSGIGATLVASEGRLVIAGLFDGGPAALGGLRRGDRVVRIDGEDATELSLAEGLQRLRGAPGTRVSVGVERDGQIHEVTLRREVVVR